jgi:hypothetical protein
MGLGKSQVRGRKRVPEPPAISTARIRVSLMLFNIPDGVALAAGPRALNQILNRAVIDRDRYNFTPTSIHLRID